MQDWNAFLTETAQGIIGAKADDLIAPKPATQVDTATASYTEGKPAAATVAGVPLLYVGLGLAALAVVGYFALRK